LLLMALVTSATLMMTPAIAEPMRMRTLYAWRGLVMRPDIDAAGPAIVRTVAILWIAGVMVGAARLIHDWRRLRHLRASIAANPDDAAHAAGTGLQELLGIRRRVPVYRSAAAGVPMVIGFARPAILLPAHAAIVLTIEQLRAVLAHELGHVRRGDVVINLLQAIGDVLMFHHPAARWLSQRVRTEREYACDDVALAVSGDAPGYARALVLLEDARDNCRLVLAAAAGTLLDRVQRILAQPRRVLTPARGALLMASAVIVALGLFALSANVPPPWVPTGARLRRPGPPPGAMAPPPTPSRPRRSVGA
jgi:beta-lactamase regulating signal transducer with metallopeptidase domain